MDEEEDELADLRLGDVPLPPEVGTDGGAQRREGVIAGGKEEEEDIIIRSPLQQNFENISKSDHRSYLYISR